MKGSLGSMTKTSLGLGTANWHRFKDANEIDTFSRLLEIENFEYIDTSPIYSQGYALSRVATSNSVLGLKIVSKVGLKYGIATRLGNMLPRGRRPYFRFFPSRIANVKTKNISNAFLDQLKELKMSSTYGLLIHNFEKHDDQSGLISELERIKSSGLTKYIGISIDQPIELIPKNIQILQVPASMICEINVQNFPGTLIINQIQKSNLVNTWKDLSVKLNAKEIVLLCGSTRYSRVNSFQKTWKALLSETEKEIFND
jgi:aryl-alcohol dehydrogenase-like predicted oxidoreductase